MLSKEWEACFPTSCYPSMRLPLGRCTPAPFTPAPVLHISMVCSGAVRELIIGTKTFLSLHPSPHGDARVSCFLFSYYLNVAGTTHINSV